MTPIDHGRPSSSTLEVPGGSRRSTILLGGALLLIALNLRLPIAAISPVLDDLRAALGLSGAVTGLLSTLPVLCFGVVAPAAPVLARRFGSETVLLGCVAAIAAGVAIRIVPEIAPLFAGTVVLGAGIAVANVLLPSVIKRDFARPGPMMGLYSMMLSGSAALSAAFTVPLEHVLGDWRWAVGAWAVPAILAMAAWAPAVRSARRDPDVEQHPPHVSLWRDRLAWLLTGLMGFQALLFYAIVAWVPDILRAAGMSSATAGFMLSIAMVCGLPTSLLTPMVAARSHDQRPIVLVVAGLWLAGLLGLLLAPGAAAPLWMVFLGLGQGAGISLALTLIVLRSPDGAHAASLSGMVQSVGYVVGAAGPLLVGIVHDAGGGWTEAIVVMLCAAGALLACGLGAGRPGMVGRPLRREPQWAY